MRNDRGRRTSAIHHVETVPAYQRFPMLLAGENLGGRRSGTDLIRDGLPEKQ